MKRLMILAVVLMTALAAFPFAYGQTGGLRISPQWPVMVESPADFQVWAQSADSYYVYVLLVTTEECYNDFPAINASIVNYPGGFIGFNKIGFTGVTLNSETVPPGVTTSGAGYTVASLKDHLDYGLSTPLGASDTIYYAFGPLSSPAFDPLTTTPVNITVTVNCDNPRMLVYLLGHSQDDSSTLFDMRVPPTNPGFVVPEIAFGSIMAAATMFTALGLFAYKRKHTTK